MVWLENDIAKTASYINDLNPPYFGAGKFRMWDIFRPLLSSTHFEYILRGITILTKFGIDLLISTF